MMNMNWILLNVSSLALTLLSCNVQVALAKQSGRSSLRGEVSTASSRPHHMTRMLQKGGGGNGGGGNGGGGNEADTANILNCFSNTLAADPTTMITNADLILCLPDLLTGLTGDAQSLQGVLSCVGAAIGCDQQTNAPQNNGNAPGNNGRQNDPSQQPQPQPFTQPPNGNTLGDLFDGSN